MFIGRTTEMAELNRLYSSDSFEMPVIYGAVAWARRALSRSLFRGKHAIYFQARRTNAEANLQYLEPSDACQSDGRGKCGV